MKKPGAMLLAAAILLGTVGCLPLFASAEGTEEDFTYEVVDGEATIMEYIGDDSDVVIPSALGGAPVTSIEGFAFAWNDRLTSVTIPESVKWIEKYAFMNCPSLTGLTVAEGNASYYSEGNCLIDHLTMTLTHGCVGSVIPENVTGIRSAAFAGCDGLTDIKLPDSVTWIGDNAFADCYSLTSITFPNGMTFIGDWAFSHCEGLHDIWIPAGVEYIGECAFGGAGLTKLAVAEGNAVYYSEGNCIITKEDMVLTHGCDASMIPDDVKEIGRGAFNSCYGLTRIVIPDGVTVIGNEAFCGCYGLKSISIPGSVTSIGEWAFETCFSLTDVAIPNRTTEVGSYAFFGCYGLTSIAIPESVVRMGNDVFTLCRALTDVYCEAELQPDDWDPDWLGCAATVYWGYKPAPVTMPGDLNGDGQIDAVDYMLLKRYVLGSFKLSDAQQVLADVSRDGKIDGVDYLLVKRHALGMYSIA